MHVEFTLTSDMFCLVVMGPLFYFLLGFLTCTIWKFEAKRSSEDVVMGLVFLFWPAFWVIVLLWLPLKGLGKALNYIFS